MFRLLGLLLIGLVLGFTQLLISADAKASNFFECNFNDTSKVSSTWNLKQRFGSLRFVFDISGDEVFIRQKGDQSRRAILEIAGRGFQTSTHTFKFHGYRWPKNKIEVTSTKSGLGPFVGNCPAVFSELKNMVAKINGKPNPLNTPSSVTVATSAASSSSRKPTLGSLTGTELCKVATIGSGDTKQWDWSGWPKVYTEAAKEAKRRGLSCGVGDVANTQIASSTDSKNGHNEDTAFHKISDVNLCGLATTVRGKHPNYLNYWLENQRYRKYVNAAKNVVWTVMSVKTHTALKAEQTPKQPPQPPLNPTHPHQQNYLLPSARLKS